MKPTCDEMTELATEHMEGRLPMSTTAMIMLHLMLCKHCSRYYAQLERVRDAAASAAEDPRPENVDALMARFREWKMQRGDG